jgi:hypothetical protein
MPTLSESPQIVSGRCPRKRAISQYVSVEAHAVPGLGPGQHADQHATSLPTAPDPDAVVDGAVEFKCRFAPDGPGHGWE